MGEKLEKFRVIGPVEVGEVAPGGTVELDPETVNIPALVESGQIEPVTKAAAEAAGKAKP